MLFILFFFRRKYSVFVQKSIKHIQWNISTLKGSEGKTKFNLGFIWALRPVQFALNSIAVHTNTGTRVEHVLQHKYVYTSFLTIIDFFIFLSLQKYWDRNTDIKQISHITSLLLLLCVAIATYVWHRFHPIWLNSIRNKILKHSLCHRQ